MSLILADNILDFWFGELDEDGMASEEKRRLWFAKDSAFDQKIRTHYGMLMELAPMGAYDLWTATKEGRVALLVLLDQFSRNLFRGQARAFYVDAKAQVIALKAIEDGLHQTLAVSYAYFILMPLMHAERLDWQDRCVGLFEELLSRSRGPAKTMIEGALDYAIAHRDIIAKFGRFPHRNAALQRKSSPEEIEFMASGGPSF